VTDLGRRFRCRAIRYTRAGGGGGHSVARSRAYFCGGTGLYFKAFLEGLGAAPPADPELRRVLEMTPLAGLLEELEKSDPVHFRAH